MAGGGARGWLAAPGTCVAARPSPLRPLPSAPPCALTPFGLRWLAASLRRPWNRTPDGQGTTAAPRAAVCTACSVQQASARRLQGRKGSPGGGGSSHTCSGRGWGCPWCGAATLLPADDGDAFLERRGAPAAVAPRPGRRPSPRAARGSPSGSPAYPQFVRRGGHLRGDTSTPPIPIGTRACRPAPATTPPRRDAPLKWPIEMPGLSALAKIFHISIFTFSVMRCGVGRGVRNQGAAVELLIKRYQSSRNSICRGNGRKILFGSEQDAKPGSCCVALWGRGSDFGGKSCLLPVVVSPKGPCLAVPRPLDMFVLSSRTRSRRGAFWVCTARQSVPPEAKLPSQWRDPLRLLGCTRRIERTAAR